jgi:hypothetical protein
VLIEFPENQKPYHEIIELIHRFPTSSQFFYWLGKDDIVLEIIKQSIRDDTYDLVSECHLDGMKIYALMGNIKLRHLSESLRLLVITEKKKFSDFVPDLSKLEKNGLSHLLSGTNYTIVSQLYYQNNLCGNIWEIYDLPNLVLTYNSRKSCLAL